MREVPAGFHGRKSSFIRMVRASRAQDGEYSGGHSARTLRLPLVHLRAALCLSARRGERTQPPAIHRKRCAPCAPPPFPCALRTFEWGASELTMGRCLSGGGRVAHSPCIARCESVGTHKSDARAITTRQKTTEIQRASRESVRGREREETASLLYYRCPKLGSALNESSARWSFSSSAALLS